VFATFLSTVFEVGAVTTFPDLTFAVVGFAVTDFAVLAITEPMVAELVVVTLSTTWEIGVDVDDCCRTALPHCRINSCDQARCAAEMVFITSISLFFCPQIADECVN
jgi:hypothetical protein